jgi:hypothetical protein
VYGKGIQYNSFHKPVNSCSGLFFVDKCLYYYYLDPVNTDGKPLHDMNILVDFFLLSIRVNTTSTARENRPMTEEGAVSIFT